MEVDWRMAELTLTTVVHPRDLGLNLSIDRKYFLALFSIAFEFKSEGC
jgi:hypothetical protein